MECSCSRAAKPIEPPNKPSYLLLYAVPFPKMASYAIYKNGTTLKSFLAPIEYIPIPP